MGSGTSCALVSQVGLETAHCVCHLLRCVWHPGVSLRCKVVHGCSGATRVSEGTSHKTYVKHQAILSGCLEKRDLFGVTKAIFMCYFAQARASKNRV